MKGCLSWCYGVLFMNVLFSKPSENVEDMLIESTEEANLVVG